MVCLRNELLPRSLLALPLPLSCKSKRRGDPQFLSQGVVHEREDVSKDVLRELPAVEVPLAALLFWCLVKIKLRARELN